MGRAAVHPQGRTMTTPYVTGATRDMWLLLAERGEWMNGSTIRFLLDVKPVSLRAVLASMVRGGRCHREKRGKAVFFMVDERCEVPTGLSVRQVQQAFAKRGAAGVSSVL